MALIITGIDISIIDKPGKENVVADFLSPFTNSDDNFPVEDSFLDEHLFAVSAHSPWYANVVNYLVAGRLLEHMSKREKRKIIQQSATYCWVNGHLFYTGPDLEIRRCVREDEIFHILKACHDEPCKGHFVDRRTGHKALRMGYYWPTLFRDAKRYMFSPVIAAKGWVSPTY